MFISIILLIAKNKSAMNKRTLQSINVLVWSNPKCQPNSKLCLFISSNDVNFLCVGAICYAFGTCKEATFLGLFNLVEQTSPFLIPIQLLGFLTCITWHSNVWTKFKPSTINHYFMKTIGSLSFFWNDQDRRFFDLKILIKKSELAILCKFK
jgi:hypothetical protein